jgi:RNA polymerase sigma-B factor
MSPSGTSLDSVAAGSERTQADRALFERFAERRDPVDRELLVERFLPLARSIASRYVRQSEPFEDIFQVACLGLVKAIDGFDVTRGRAFSSFAVPTIAGEIKRYYRDRTWSVHVPRDLQELTLQIERARNELEREHSRSPTVPEIAARLDIDAEDVMEALQARHAQRAGSLDAPVKNDDDSAATVAELVGVSEKGFELAEDRADLRSLARALTPRERLVIQLRFGHDMTQKEIGDHIGVSQMQVSRILRGAIERLREHAEQRQRRSSNVTSSGVAGRAARRAA